MVSGGFYLKVFMNLMVKLQPVLMDWNWTSHRLKVIRAYSKLVFRWSRLARLMLWVLMSAVKDLSADVKAAVAASRSNTSSDQPSSILILINYFPEFQENWTLKACAFSTGKSAGFFFIVVYARLFPVFTEWYEWRECRNFKK